MNEPIAESHIHGGVDEDGHEERCCGESLRRVESEGIDEAGVAAINPPTSPSTLTTLRPLVRKEAKFL